MLGDSNRGMVMESMLAAEFSSNGAIPRSNKYSRHQDFLLSVFSIATRSRNEIPKTDDRDHCNR